MTKRPNHRKQEQRKICLRRPYWREKQERLKWSKEEKITRLSQLVRCRKCWTSHMWLLFSHMRSGRSGHTRGHIFRRLRHMGAAERASPCRSWSRPWQHKTRDSRSSSRAKTICSRDSSKSWLSSGSRYCIYSQCRRSSRQWRARRIISRLMAYRKSRGLRPKISTRCWSFWSRRCWRLKSPDQEIITEIKKEIIEDIKMIEAVVGIEELATSGLWVIWIISV